MSSRQGALARGSGLALSFAAPGRLLVSVEKRWVGTLTACLVAAVASSAPGPAYDKPMPQSLQAAPPPDLTDIERVNQFIGNSKPQQTDCEQIGKLQQGAKLKTRLLTPLNSSFNRAGDPVVAVISEAAPGDLGALLPVGTRLYGNVESSRPNSRPRQDGLILITFYEAATGTRRFDLKFELGSRDRLIHPVRLPPTRKQKVRSFLIMTSRIAIPLAIGTGGTSMAITAGAGAVLGGVLADNHKYLQGALQGAWESSIFSVFDPVVYKGGSVSIPWGSVITLQLEDKRAISPILATPPHSSFRKTLRSEKSIALSPDLFPSSPRAILSTSAELLQEHAQKEAASQRSKQNIASPAGQAASELAKAERFIAERNLAAALGALDKASNLQPNDPNIAVERDKVLNMVTGRMSGH